MTAAVASHQPVLKRISPGAAFGLSMLLIVGGISVLVWPKDSASKTTNLATSAASGSSEEASTAWPSVGAQNLNPAPKLNQTVTIRGIPQQGHTYLLTAAGCPGSEVLAESYVNSSTAKLGFEVSLTDDAVAETRVKVGIVQSGQPITEMDLNRLDPVTVAVDLDEGSFTLTLSSQNGSSNECAETEFTVILRNYVLSEG